MILRMVFLGYLYFFIHQMYAINDFFKAIAGGVAYVIKNFPVIVVLLCGLLVLLCLNNHGAYPWWMSEHGDKVSFSFIAACLTSLCMTINNRSQNNSPWWEILSQTIAVLIGGVIYRVRINYAHKEMIEYGIFICLFLLVVKVFLAYCKRGKENEDSIWYYYSTLIGHVIVGMVYGMTIMLGLFAIIKSVLYLFDISSNHLWMADIAYFAWVVVTPLVFLSYTKFDAESYNIHKFVQFFAKYVLVSLLIVYAVVLLVYIGKILLTQERPKGILIYMIYGFATIGLATLYILYPLRTTNPNYIKRQRIYGGVLFLFLIVGIFAIVIRVHQYGLTAPRYLVILLLLWFFYVAFCALFPRYFHLQNNIFVLGILGFLGVFARPLNMYQMVLNSQLGRRESVLARNHLLDENKMVITGNHQDTVSTGDVAILSSIVDYIVDTYEPALSTPSVFEKYIPGFTQVRNTTSGGQYDEAIDKRVSIMHQIGLPYDRNYPYTMGDQEVFLPNTMDYYAGHNREIQLGDQKVHKITMSSYQSETSRTYDKETDLIKINVNDNATCMVKQQDILTSIKDKHTTEIGASDDMQIMGAKPIDETSYYASKPVQIIGEDCTLRVLNITLESVIDQEYTIGYLEGLVVTK